MTFEALLCCGCLVVVSECQCIVTGDRTTRVDILTLIETASLFFSVTLVKIFRNDVLLRTEKKVRLTL